jgi:hypothetical protein
MFFCLAFGIFSIQAVEQTRKGNTASFVSPAEEWVGKVSLFKKRLFALHGWKDRIAAGRRFG